MIYLDHHAATPTCDEARRAMSAAMKDAWANPSSAHRAGRRARALLEEARRAVARALGADAADVVLTSGGTESIHLGVLGLGRGLPRVVTTDIEHPAVVESIRRLEDRGAEVRRIHIPAGSPPDAASVSTWLGPDTLLAVQWVNHETGTLLPVPGWASAARRRGARVFVDATQALGPVGVDVTRVDADALAVASHKVGGPAGAGALWVRRAMGIPPQLAGGAQERGRRPGSPDTLAHVGFGAACDALGRRRERMRALGPLRDALERELTAHHAVVNGAGAPRVPTVSCVSVPGWESAALVAALDIEGVCASSGAACSSGLAEPSPVLLAMYPGEPWRAASSLRLSLGPETEEREMRSARSIIRRVIGRAGGAGCEPEQPPVNSRMG